MGESLGSVAGDLVLDPDRRAPADQLQDGCADVKGRKLAIAV